MKKLLLLALTTLMAACSSLPPTGIDPVSPFDLNRYQGKWYEIARLDHFFERGLSDISATYTPKADGSVELKNRGFNIEKQEWREAIGKAVFTDVPTRAALKVSFFGPFYAGYNAIALDPDYRWVLIMGSERSSFWILSRDKQLSPELRDKLLQRAKLAGVDTDKLIWVSQSRSDN